MKEEVPLSHDLKVNLLKDLDGMYSAQSNVICTWNSEGPCVVIDELEDLPVTSVEGITLDVKFYLNSNNKVVRMYIS
jgi:hypothetical protein